MIKILVTSDIHGDSSIVNLLYLSHQDYDYFLDCGDSQLPDYMIRPFISVKGNCDYGNDYPPTRYINTPFGRIYIEHGNNSFLDEEYIKSKDALIFLSGHTHKKSLIKIDENHYYANPGSASRPRDDYASYLEIIIDNDKINFQFKKVDLDL